MTCVGSVPTGNMKGKLDHFTLRFSSVFGTLMNGTTTPHSSSGIRQATGWTIGVPVPICPRNLFSAQNPDLTFVPTSYLPSGYHGGIPYRKRVRAMKFSAHIRLMPKTKNSGVVPPFLHTLLWRDV